MRGAPWRKTKKTVRSLNSGHLEIESSRDREGTFSPKIIPKRQLTVTSELEDKPGRRSGIT